MGDVDEGVNGKQLVARRRSRGRGRGVDGGENAVKPILHVGDEVFGMGNRRGEGMGALEGEEGVLEFEAESGADKRTVERVRVGGGACETSSRGVVGGRARRVGDGDAGLGILDPEKEDARGGVERAAEVVEEAESGKEVSGEAVELDFSVGE